MFTQTVEEQATGCAGANGYRDWARERGYNKVEVYDWTSSAGDWVFLVSRDGFEWRLLFQTNNWPRAGFSYALSEQIFFGSFEEVCDEVATI